MGMSLPHSFYWFKQTPPLNNPYGRDSPPYNNPPKGWWSFLYREEDYESVGRFVSFPIGEDTPETRLGIGIGATPLILTKLWS